MSNSIIDMIKNFRKQKTMDIVNAKAALKTARTKNLNVIDYQLLNIQKYGSNKLHAAQVTNARQSIKNAYYSLSVIEIIEARIDEMAITNELAEGMNEVVHAMKLINHFNARAEKPQLRKFNKQFEKMSKKGDKAVIKMEKMGDSYEAAVSRAIDTDNMVDDSIIDRLMAGEDPLECLQTDTSIRNSYDPIGGEIEFGGEYQKLVNEYIDLASDADDFSSMNLDDLKG